VEEWGQTVFGGSARPLRNAFWVESEKTVAAA